MRILIKVLLGRYSVLFYSRPKVSSIFTAEFGANRYSTTLKRATWFRGGQDDEKAWKPLPKSRSQRRIFKRKKKVFPKAGNKSKSENSTVVFVPSTRGSILLTSLKEEEDKMAEMTGFRIKYQEAGGSILANAFNKNLGIGQPCGRKNCPPCIESGGKVNCKARSIVYESKCLVCNPVSSI